jgi:hypothetical protein
MDGGITSDGCGKSPSPHWPASISTTGGKRIVDDYGWTSLRAGESAYKYTRNKRSRGLAWKQCASHDVPVPGDVISHPLGLQDLTLWLVERWGLSGAGW